MSSDFYIYTHLGLGDQLVCNGLIRNICKKYEDRTVHLFCKQRCLESVSFMFRDISNILVEVKDDNDAHAFLPTIDASDKIYVGHHHLFGHVGKIECAEKAYYKQVGLKHSRKWDDFYIQRDLDREANLFDTTKLKGQDYIIFQDDPKNNRRINRDFLIGKNMRVFSPDESITGNIFDYLTIVENAKEIHVVESCFMYMVDLVYKSLPASLYAHRYARPLQQWEFPANRLNWNILT